MGEIENRRFAAEQQYIRVLGRQARPEELDYIVGLMENDAISAEEVGQALQGTPEYQQTRLNKDTAAYGAQLNEQNAAILDQAGAAANSRFASLGRPNTSALGASVLRAGGQLAQDRQSALASFYSNGLNRNAALGAGQGQGIIDRAYGRKDEARQRNYAIEDYYRQKNDAADYERAHSGWNAITPEFAVNTAIGTAGKIGAAYAGGYGASRGAAGKGLF